MSLFTEHSGGDVLRNPCRVFTGGDIKTTIAAAASIAPAITPARRILWNNNLLEGVFEDVCKTITLF